MPPVSNSEKYFSLVKDRNCDECMVCCNYLSINTSVLKKPADELCKNYVKNHGCSIYDTRPNVCRTWHCLWRRTAALPDELRPDKCNVLFSLNVSFEPMQIFENAYIVCMALTDPSAFDNSSVSAALDMFIEDGSLPVWLSYAGSKSLVWPKKELADAILYPSTSQSTDLIPAGKAWVNRFNGMLEPLQDLQATFGLEFLRA